VSSVVTTCLSVKLSAHDQELFRSVSDLLFSRLRRLNQSQCLVLFSVYSMRLRCLCVPCDRRDGSGTENALKYSVRLAV